MPARGHIVDVGTGTGTLAIALASARPDACVTAVDGDARELGLAARKAGADRVHWRHGLAGALDVGEAGADAVVMSLLLHHLAPDAKRAALRRAAIVLRAGGRLHIADWGRPTGPAMRVGFAALQLLDGIEGTRDHAAIVREAGFPRVDLYARVRTAWGSLELLEARPGR